MTTRERRKLQSRQAIIDAGLNLRAEKRAFSNVSLREVAREAGLVPTAFYRHFKDMDEFGVALVKETAETLHTLIPNILAEFKLLPNQSKSQQGLNVFFRSVHEHRREWGFLIGERWGGTPVISEALSVEINLFQKDLVSLFSQTEDFKAMSEEELFVFGDIVLNLFFSWGMLWLNHLHEPDEEKQLEQRKQLMQHVGGQVKLLFKGVRHWA